MGVFSMKSFVQKLRRREMKPVSRRRAARPVVEGLEDRIVLFTANGGMWTYPLQITYSFVPDGTNIGGVSSNLFSTLNAVESTSAWQHAIEEAAAIWSQSTNVNLTLVSDNGAPEGTSGNQQGDTRFGDIRIGMFAQGSGYLAITNSPPPLNGGTNAGDITFNSSYNWSPTRGYDLETVALHELGHSLGLGESTSWGSVMYAYYGGVNITPNTDDLAGIQSIYGAVTAPYGSNKGLLTAYNLSSMINGNGQLSLGNQSIQDGNDAAYWYVTVPANTNGTMTASVQATNLSSLAPKVSIYNSAKVGIANNSLANVYGGTATLTITGVSPGQGYYIRVGAASSLGSVGAYGLLVNFGSLSQATIAPPHSVVASLPDQGGGVDFQHATTDFVLAHDPESLLKTLQRQLGDSTIDLQSWLNILPTLSSADASAILAALQQSGQLATSATTTQASDVPQSGHVVDITGTSLETAPTAPPSTVTTFPVASTNAVDATLADLDLTPSKVKDAKVKDASKTKK